MVLHPAPTYRRAPHIVSAMSTTAPEDVAWDLEPLVDGDGEAGAQRLLDEADERAARFAEQFAGKIAELDGEGLTAAVEELALISEAVGRVGSYASLRFSTDTADPANGALLQRWRGGGTVRDPTLLFPDVKGAGWAAPRAGELPPGRGWEETRH